MITEGDFIMNEYDKDEEDDYYDDSTANVHLTGNLKWDTASEHNYNYFNSYN